MLGLELFDYLDFVLWNHIVFMKVQGDLLAGDLDWFAATTGTADLTLYRRMAGVARKPSEMVGVINESQVCNHSCKFKDFFYLCSHVRERKLNYRPALVVEW